MITTERLAEHYIQAADRLAEARRKLNMSDSAYTMNTYALTKEQAQEVIENAKDMIKQRRGEIAALELALRTFEIRVANEGCEAYAAGFSN